jgi:hypothetical protein
MCSNLICCFEETMTLPELYILIPGIAKKVTFFVVIFFMIKIWLIPFLTPKEFNIHHLRQSLGVRILPYTSTPEELNLPSNREGSNQILFCFSTIK